MSEVGTTIDGDETITRLRNWIRGMRLDRPETRPGLIYFIQFDNWNIVKIGYTNGQSVRSRLRTLQTGFPFQLRSILEIPGDVYDEQSLHTRFHKLKIRGEWYRLEGELLAFVKAHPPRPKLRP